MKELKVLEARLASLEALLAGVERPDPSTIRFPGALDIDILNANFLKAMEGRIGFFNAMEGRIDFFNASDGNIDRLNALEGAIVFLMAMGDFRATNVDVLGDVRAANVIAEISVCAQSGTVCLF